MSWELLALLLIGLVAGAALAYFRSSSTPYAPRLEEELKETEGERPRGHPRVGPG